MTEYILRRLISLIPMWIGITAIVFTLSWLIPGDAVVAIVSRHG